MRDYINDTLRPEFDAEMTRIIGEFNTGIGETLTRVDESDTANAAKIDEVVTFVKTQLDGSTITEILAAAQQAAQLVDAPADDVMTTLLNNPASGTSQRLTAEIDQRTSTQVPPLVAEAIAADNAPAQAAAAAVTAEIAGRNLLDGDDPRVPQLTDAEEYTHAWADPRRRVSLYARPNGEIVAPVGLETRYAGVPMPEHVDYAWAALYDAARRRFGELVLGADGSVPQWVLDRWVQRMNFTGTPVDTGTRTTAVALTLSAGTNVDTATAVHVRWPFKIAPNVRRFRIHIRNHNDRASVAYPGALSVNGIWAGPHAVNSDGSLSGNWAATPTRISDAFATPANGGEYVTNWIEPSTFELAGSTDYLIALGYTGAAQNNHLGMGGCWRSDYPADVASVNPANPLTRRQDSPLDVWMEVEVDGTVPISAYLGDSLTVGSGATLPVYDSYGAKHAMAHGAVPLIVAHHGSQMADWSNASAWKWQKYAGLDKPDSVLWALGGNDVSSGIDLPTAQARFNTLVPIVRDHLSKNIYLANLMPRTNNATFNAARPAYNDWLDTLPGGAINVFDFYTPIRDTSSPDVINPAFDSGDRTHLNTAGYAKNARSITHKLAEPTK